MIEPHRAVVINDATDGSRVLITPSFIAFEVAGTDHCHVQFVGVAMGARQAVTSRQSMDDLANAYQALPIDAADPSALASNMTNDAHDAWTEDDQ